MKKFLINLFWFNLSTSLNLSLTDTKLHLRNIIERTEKGTITSKELSPEISRALDFYLENIDYLV